MSRFVQPEGTRGSLKWIQRAVNDRPDILARDLLPKLRHATSINWRSPLRDDEFAEYRDSAFLERIDLGQWSEALAEFWPQPGPQWDALGVSDRGDILLVEAKAHLAEICSPASKASVTSLTRIKTVLSETAVALDATPRADWAVVFYQLANRLAHLHFLRSRGVPAWLVLVSFIGDTDIKGPQTAAEWEAAYLVVLHVMGIPANAALMKHVAHVFPHVTDLS